MHALPLIEDDPRAIEALANVRVLYTDLDGTLVAPGGCVLADALGNPSTVTADAIVELNRAGLAVVPISGRERDQLRELSRLLGWEAYIAEAGGIIVHGTGHGADVRLDYGTWPRDILEEGTTPFDAINEVRAAERLAEAFPGRIEQYSTVPRPREVSLLLRGCCFDLAAAQEVLDTLPLALDLVDNGMLRGYGTLTYREGPAHAYHVVPRGVSKARAIALDLAWRGLGPENAAAIGDSATDLQMADAVAVMALVSNALESPGVQDGLVAVQRDNVWRTAGARGEGWAEFARTWMHAVKR